MLDEENRVLLCRFVIPRLAGTVLRAAPGGGTEAGETPRAALRRNCGRRPGSCWGTIRRTCGTRRSWRRGTPRATTAS
ncbi:hypothetical protein [Actinacidiphila sp. bgisy144]|uniref:hypothetical protein n=1 Tax=Actinacidiphila sp. bgisy144 TaxID=3413791 RepID=UPI003EBA34BD